VLPLLRRFDLGRSFYRLEGVAGCHMAIADDVRKCVIFIGHGDEAHFTSCGTAFFLQHSSADYLVTARHVARALGNDPFSLRINRKDGGSNTYTHDPHVDDLPWFKWFFPEDSSVDLAVIPFNVDAKALGLDLRVLAGEDWILDEVKFRQEKVGIGDICHAVGLFRVLQGTRRNVPVVHTGHVALLAGEERIPVKDRNCPGSTMLINAHLVELANLDGLSGAPVFVRAGLELKDLEVGELGKRGLLGQDSKLHLLGVWQGSWEQELPQGQRVPVGVGVVVPATDLLALLNQADVAEERNRLLQLRVAASPDVKEPSGA
jgi:hypothetical protein